MSVFHRPDELPPPIPAERKITKDVKKPFEDKKDLKEKQKRENEYKKRFKVGVLLS